MSGPLVFFGGNEWSAVSAADEWIASRASSVAVVPTATAFENPSLRVAAAEHVFAGLGCSVDAVPLVAARDADDPAIAEVLSRATATYITSGSPMHLRSVLVESAAWTAIVERWNAGGILIASGESAGALSHVMVDPRGGAFTVGLGLFDGLAVCGRLNTWSDDRLHRTVTLAAHDLAVVAIDDGTALIWDGTWSTVGDGRVACYRAGREIAISDLPAPTS